MFPAWTEIPRGQVVQPSLYVDEVAGSNPGSDAQLTGVFAYGNLQASKSELSMGAVLWVVGLAALLTESDHIECNPEVHRD